MSGLSAWLLGSLPLSISTIDFRYHIWVMPFPIKTCAICGEEFELKPDKPGFANRCPVCSEPESTGPEADNPADYAGRHAEHEVNAARRRAIRDLLYRKDG